MKEKVKLKQFSFSGFRECIKQGPLTHPECSLQSPPSLWESHFPEIGAALRVSPLLCYHRGPCKQAASVQFPSPAQDLLPHRQVADTELRCQYLLPLDETPPASMSLQVNIHEHLVAPLAEPLIWSIKLNLTHSLSFSGFVSNYQ